MVKSTTIRLVLSLAVTNGWKLHEIDIQNVFLYAPLSEKNFMQQPLNFVDSKYPHFV